MNESNYNTYLLNENNKYIEPEFINNLLKKYGINYKIKDIKIFQQAMTHSSYIFRDYANDKLIKMIKEKNIDPIKDPSQAIPLQPKSYENLEFLGDSVIHLILAEYLYNRYHKYHDEGFLTKLRTKIENGRTLAYLAKKLDLHNYVLIARNIEQIGGRENNEHIFEDTFEALLGALYLDGNNNFDLCKQFVINIIETHIDIASLIHKDTNYKDLLLQYYHKMKWSDPEYKLQDITEKDTKKYFNMCVLCESKIVGWGSGTSKKKAEQIAAYNALIKFDQYKDESEDEISYS